MDFTHAASVKRADNFKRTKTRACARAFAADLLGQLKHAERVRGMRAKSDASMG